MNHKTAPSRLAAFIIIPCWSQLEFTRQCICKFQLCARPPWELIVIDNGSTDGAAAGCAACRMPRLCRSP